MKGTTFQRPLEYNLVADGEVWEQGDRIKGTLKVSNHENEIQSIQNLKITLGHGQFKKVHAKDKSALQLLENCIVADSIELGPKEEKEFSWEFNLLPDAPITDNIGSLYLIYGSSEDIWECGHLQLNVEMKTILQQFLQIFEDFFRFKIGPSKFKKGFTEVKLIPPKSKELSTIHALTCSLRLNGQDLEVIYTFTVNSLQTGPEGVALAKNKKVFEQKLAPKEYQIYGESLNYDGVKSAIGDIIQEVIPKVLF